jgi:hypothetical protein
MPRLFPVPGPVFKAKFPGKCLLCGQRFPAGVRIRYIAKHTVGHEGCHVPAYTFNPVNDPVTGAEEWAARYGPARPVGRGVSPGGNHKPACTQGRYP